MSKMPTVFIPHGGGPCFFMDWNPPDAWDNMARYLRNLSNDIGQKPKAIVVISAHWEEDDISVQSNPAPELLFDYYGFPKHTYELEYPAPGSSELASRIKTLMEKNDISTRVVTNRGFDHGVFIPLKLVFPEADIPIVQLSLRSDLDPAAHIKAGEALQPLRDEKILILGSGMTYHNLSVMIGPGQRGQKGASNMREFDQWLTKAVLDPDYRRRNDKLANWSAAPSARDAHPREEHLIPLHVVAGAAGADIGRQMLKDTVLGTPQSAFQFG